MRRQVRVGVSDLLSLVACADDYGYRNDVLFDGFAGWLGRTLSDEEIGVAAKDAAAFEEDMDDRGRLEKRVRESLVEFRARYMGK